MKRKVYYLTFTVLGALVGFFIHAIVELKYLDLLLTDFSRYGLGWTWGTWEQIHAFGTLGLVLVGGWLGWRGGRKFWKILYVDGKYNRRFRKPLREDF